MNALILFTALNVVFFVINFWKISTEVKDKLNELDEKLNEIKKILENERD